jgi:hypothetical protein
MNVELLEKDLIGSFHSIERKYAGRPGNEGITDQPKEQITARLQESASAPDVEEFQCNMKHEWETFIFHALLKRYGIKPYRYRKQRKTTILVRVSKAAMNGLLWPIFTDVAAELSARFTVVTTTLLPAIAPGPFSLAVLDHDHSTGQLCENCRKRLLEEGR